MTRYQFCISSLLILSIALGCQQGDSKLAPRNGETRQAEANASAAAKQDETESQGTDDLDGAIESQPLSSTQALPDGVPLFELLPPEATGVDFQLQLPDIEKHVREFIHLNVNGGVCTGDYDGDGLADFYVTSPVDGNRLYRNLGNFRFQDVTEQANVSAPLFWGTGATFVDVDNDGDLDLYACGYLKSNRLYINQGAGPDGRVRFEEEAYSRGVAFDGASMTMAFADMDNDGDLDGYLATTAKAPPPGVKFQVRFEGKKPVVLERLREYWDLLYLPGDRAHRTEAGQFDHLYRNDGGQFTEVTKAAGIDGPYFTLSATWWDYNHDGYPDIYAANDFMGPDRLYHNNGDGTFTEVAQEVLPHTPWFSMGTDLADVNNDGLIDFLATDMSSRTHYRDMIMMGNVENSGWFLEFAEPRQYVRNALYLNSGAGRMMEVAHLADMASTDWTWNPRLADFDNDGRVDLFVTNGVTRDTMNSDLGNYADSHFGPGSNEWAHFWAGQSMHKERNVALRNLGDLEFESVAAEWGLDRVGVSFGAATADFDNDGDLDMVVNNSDVPLSIYRNRGDRGQRIRIRLVGRASNRFGIGATIELVAGGLRQTNYVTLARGWLSANEPIATFGLGDADTVDELRVIWPSGHVQSFTDLPAGRLYTITEPSGDSPRGRRAVSPSTEQPAPADTPFVADPMFTQIEYADSSYDDFAAQPLLPNKLSESGPTMAWGDVDGDRADDVYAGGTKGRPGRMFINSGDGLFNTRPSPDFDKDRQCEDTGSTFFDADGDGDLDLYVVSGSVEFKEGNEAYRDRLYLNDGQGRFQRADEGTLPDLRDSGSVVAPCDFDRDGDVDLLVGSRSIPGKYPLAPRNRILVNTGGGRFEEQTPDEIGSAGMVTDAEWADIDGDGWFDLLLTTDWGPVRVIQNQQGQFVEVTATAGLAERLGWWLAIASGDVDEDGDTDFVVTNFGLNTKYRASSEKPELLYYGDLDGSGEPHIVEAQFEGDTIYPRRGFQSLREAMPILSAKFNTFHDFASSSLPDIFTQDRLDEALRLQVNTLETGVLVNEGDFRFRFEPLPRMAQVAPGTGVAVADLTGDGHLDIVLAQNFFGPERYTGQMDGGVSLLLVGDGRGQFEPVWPNRSGILVPGDARHVQVVELQGDEWPDLVFAVNNGLWRAFANRFGRTRSAARDQ